VSCSRSVFRYFGGTHCLHLKGDWFCSTWVLQGIWKMSLFWGSCRNCGFSHFRGSDWLDFLQLPRVAVTFISSQPLSHPCEPEPITLKMEAVRFSEMSVYSPAARHGYPQEDKLIKRREKLIPSFSYVSCTQEFWIWRHEIVCMSVNDHVDIP
jgi:hypothetical protein